MAINKQDSNQTGLAIAEEETLKTLPTTPVWYEAEPNSYADLGADYTLAARTPINAGRQRRKGVLVDLDASGGYNSDVTKNNLNRLIQGFMWARAREKFSTQPLNGTAIPITGVVATGNHYEATSDLDGALVGSLLLGSNYSNVENNGLKVTTVVVADDITVAETLVNETPGATAKLDVVGFQFPSDDLDINENTTTIDLESTVTDLTTLDLNVGEWVFLGGDTAATRFVNTEPGYGRIKSISTNLIELDETTFTATDETGTSLTIQLFFGNVTHNERTSSLIRRFSYQLERQLGEDADGVQSEYLIGAIPNVFTLNMPTAEIMNADLGFVGLDVEQRTGTQGIKTGTRISAPIEDAYNTTSNVYRIKLSVIDPSSMNPEALFGYISEATLAIDNGVVPNKAIATLGGFDTSAGDFKVDGTMTAYFTEVAAIAAIRNNSDLGFNVISAQDNTGFVFDIPLLGLSGGQLAVEKDEPITIPLEKAGAECENGYTLLHTAFGYLPAVAMPV